jgi:hypothetical protein
MLKEHRKNPRRMMNRQSVTIPVSTKIQVIDIGMGGVLFECAEPMSVGARGTLRLNLDGVPFVVEVHVLRVSPASADESTYRVAGSYVNVNTTHRRLIDRFMSA